MDDPYSTVRFVTHRSLKTLPGFEDFRYNFVGSAEERSHVRKRIILDWNNRTKTSFDRSGLQRLINSMGRLNSELVEALLEQRDDRPVSISE